MNKDVFKKDLNIKDVFISILIILSLVIYAFIFIYPKYNDFIEAKNKLNRLEVSKNTYEYKIHEIAILEGDLNNLINERDNKSEQLKHNMEDGMFLIGLSKNLQKYNIELVSYSIEDTIKYEGFYAIPTNIELKGDYKHIRKIIDYMEEQKNITQVLDYSIASYTEELNQENTEEIKIIDPIVYWINESTDNLYHKIDCEILKEEIVEFNGDISSGDYMNSEKAEACEVCKPYTINKDSNKTDTNSSVSNGIVVATFKFIMYSSYNPTLDLNNDDSTIWKPGKFNPFVTTTTLDN